MPQASFEMHLIIRPRSSDICDQSATMFDMSDLSIDLFEMEKWEKLNEDLGGMIHLGVSHAIYEVIQSLAQTYSHKKTIVVIEKQTHHFDDLLSYFYKEAYQVLKFSNEQFDEIEKTIQEKSTEIVFVLHSMDQPVTGEIFDFARLDQLLNSKRVFSVMTSFQHHVHHDYKLGAFSVCIQRLSKNRSLTFYGNRVKLKPILAHKMNWNSSEQENLHIQKLMNKTNVENQDLVLQLEKELGCGFLQNQSRIFDRLVLVFDDLNAAALRDLLNQYQIKSDCINSCQWNFLADLNKWWSPSLTQEQVRGLIVIFIGQFDSDSFKKNIKEAVVKLRSLSAL